jgi:hypothetical protein
MDATRLRGAVSHAEETCVTTCVPKDSRGSSFWPPAGQVPVLLVLMTAWWPVPVASALILRGCRLRHDPAVQAAPATLRGKPTGPAIRARHAARRRAGTRRRPGPGAPAPHPSGHPGARGSPLDALPHHALRARLSVIQARRPAGVSSRANRRSVAVQDLGLVRVPRGGGTVRVQDQGPAPPVDHNLVVEPQ